MSDAEPIWSVKVSVDEVAESGSHFDLVADETTRAALAKAVGLRDLPLLEASFDASRGGRGRLHVVGAVSARVGQNCVVTLEPLENELIESVDLVFAPPPEPSGAEKPGEATIDSTAPEPTETLVGGAVDLGAIATEFLMLGIDPYPRKPGVVFESRMAGDPSARPFAALAALKQRKVEDNG